MFYKKVVTKDAEGKDVETYEGFEPTIPFDKSVDAQELADFCEGALQIGSTGETVAKALLERYKVLQK